MTSPRGKDQRALGTEQRFTQPQRIPGRSYERPALRCDWAFYPVQVAFLAAVYFGAAKLGLSMAFVAEQVTAVWPPTGIALAALLLFGSRAWPGITLGAFLANATANAPLATAAGIALGNTLGALLGAWLLRRLVGFDKALERVQDVLGLVVLAAWPFRILAQSDVSVWPDRLTRLGAFLRQRCDLDASRPRLGHGQSLQGAAGGARSGSASATPIGRTRRECRAGSAYRGAERDEACPRAGGAAGVPQRTRFVRFRRRWR